MNWRRITLCCLAPALALALAQGRSAEAFQRGRWGPSPSQIKALQNQMAFMQLEVARVQAETALKQEEIYKSFDQDGDGKLTGGEKLRFDKHMRDIQTGKIPNPFALIIPVGKGKKPRSPMDELRKRGIQYQTDFEAKQREIYNRYDENGNGHLEGPEKAKFDKYVNDVEAGRVPNPFATLAIPPQPTANKPGK